MATSRAALSAAAAAVSSGTSSTIGQTIVGSYLFRIDGFSGTKDLGAGKSIKSSTFSVGGHDWYIKCYPCGKYKKSAVWVTMHLCLDHSAGPEDKVEAECVFTLMDKYNGLADKPKRLDLFAFSTAQEARGIVFIEMEKLKECLEDDCFKVRCDVSVAKKIEIPEAMPWPGLATAEAGSHVLTLEGYSKTLGGIGNGDSIESHPFHVGGHSWLIDFFPRGDEDEEPDEFFTAYLCIYEYDDGFRGDEEVKVRCEMTLLTHAGVVISSKQDFCNMTDDENLAFRFLHKMGHASSPLLQNTFHIRCDIAVVNEIMAVPLPPQIQNQRIDDLQRSQQIEGDLTFEVGGHLFTAHKYVLASRSSAFMADFFGPGKENAVGATRVRIDDMEPRVFKSLLHFIYTDTLPDEVHGDDNKVVMAQGLLVAADRYAMERLKLICADMLCGYITDARNAVSTLRLADKYGCHGLKEACFKFLTDQFTKD